MDNKQIGKYLFNLRKEEGKTQKEIADQLGVTYQAVSRWENGDSIPDIETLCLLADMYQVSIDEILQRTPVVNDDEEPMGILALMSMIAYVVAIVIFLAINAIWFNVVAVALFVIISLGGLIPANVYYFYQPNQRTSMKLYLYLATYIPLIIGIIIVIVQS